VAVSERLFNDPDFRFFNEGAASKAECKHCGTVMWAIETDSHRAVCLLGPGNPSSGAISR